MKVSVIIATADRPELLQKALAAVQVALSHIDGGEIIVIDNGVSAEDGGPEEKDEGGNLKPEKEGREKRDEGGNLKPEKEGREKTDVGGQRSEVGGRSVELANQPIIQSSNNSDTTPCVSILRSEPRNKAKALNVGIATAKYEWLAFTDDDCLPEENWLVEAQKFIQETKLRVFGGKVIAGALPEGAPHWLKPGKSGVVPRGPAIVDYAPMPTSGVLDDKMQVPLGANFFVHKSVFEKHGSYDEALWERCGRSALGSEDAEFGIRIRRQGESIGYSEKSVVCHPVLLERATIKSHLRWAYRFGVREKYLFPDEIPKRSVVLKGVLRDVFWAFLYGIRGDSAVSVSFSMRAVSGLASL